MAGDWQVRITVQAVSGSAPCDLGAQMVVSLEHIAGSIGGGRMEYEAIQRAQNWLTHPDGQIVFEHEQSLGPNLGQCCGGYVRLQFAKIQSSSESFLPVQPIEEPVIAIFGAGHIGTNLGKIFRALDYSVRIFDSRETILGMTEFRRNDLSGGEADYEIAPIAEEKIDALPLASTVLIMTHDHGLDFLIAAHALERSDWRYLGMIGSKTKAARFRSQFALSKTQADRLHCPMFKSPAPIGQKNPSSKQPQAIALEIAAGLVQILR